MYSESIAVAAATLVVNKRVRAEAAELRAYANALRVKFRRHRFFYVSGGSEPNDGDHVRVLLRDFCTAEEPPKSYVGYSRGSACQACGRTIKPGDVEYDLVTPAATLRLDGPCYGVFIDVQSTTPGAATP